MPLPQKKFREIVFQMLYGLEEGKARDDDMVELLMKELKVTKKSVKEAQNRSEEILSLLPALDEQIALISIGYNFERIQTVEKNILRLATYELLYDNSIPAKVAISEGVRLAKKFSTPESVSFVNAILDAIYKKSLGENANLAELKMSVQNLLEKEEVIAKLPELEIQACHSDEEEDLEHE